MKAWKRARAWLLCGYDAQCRIAPGDPYLERKGGEWKRALIRCERHAGEPVGTIDEPPIAVPRPPSTAKPLRWLANQAKARVLRHERPKAPAPFDPRAAAANDRGDA